jgi:hypothetical protein
VSLLAGTFWDRQDRCSVEKWLHRLRRLLASGSPVLFVGGIGLAGLAISSLKESSSLNPFVTWGLFALLLALLMFQMRAEYRRRTYDPTWILRFDDKFDCEKMRSRRSKAAKAIRDNRERLGCPNFSCAEIDDVLDFFEALGFFMQGDEITPEVVHHAFYH